MINFSTPFTDGNKYSTDAFLSAVNQILQGGNFSQEEMSAMMKNLQEKVGSGNPTMGNPMYYQFQLFLYYRQQFCSGITTDNVKLIPLLTNLLGAWFDNGKVAVRKLGDKFGVFIYMNEKYDSDGTILSANGIPYTQIGGTMGKKQKISGIKLSSKNSAFLKFGDIGYPAWFWLWPTLRHVSDMLTSFHTSITMSCKKFIYHVKNNNSDIQNKEVASFTDLTTPFIKRISGTNPDLKKGDIPNRIEQLKEFGDINIGLLDVLTKYLQIFDSWWGKYTHQFSKKSRLIEGEVKLNNYNFITLQEGNYRQFKYFMYQAKKIGLDLQITKTVDLLDEIKDPEANTKKET